MWQQSPLFMIMEWHHFVSDFLLKICFGIMATMIALTLIWFGSWDIEQACRIMTIAMVPLLLGCIITLFCYDAYMSSGGYLFTVIPMQLSGLLLMGFVLSRFGAQLTAA
jgi:hypothetical protein